MPYYQCDKCGYIADVHYTYAYVDCPKCEGVMREMSAEPELIEKLKPLFRQMKQDTEELKRAVDTLYQSIKDLSKLLKE